jgi:hypothetical protein
MLIMYKNMRKIAEFVQILQITNKSGFNLHKFSRNLLKAEIRK